MLKLYENIVIIESSIIYRVALETKMADRRLNRRSYLFIFSHFLARKLVEESSIVRREAAEGGRLLFHHVAKPPNVGGPIAATGPQQLPIFAERARGHVTLVAFEDRHRHQPHLRPHKQRGHIQNIRGGQVYLIRANCFARF